MRDAIRRAWRETLDGNPDRLCGMLALLALCWAVIAGAGGAALGLVGAISLRDPTGQIIGLIALGPFALGVCVLVASAPFFALWELLHDDEEEK